MDSLEKMLPIKIHHIGILFWLKGSQKFALIVIFRFFFFLSPFPQNYGSSLNLKDCWVFWVLVIENIHFLFLSFWLFLSHQCPCWRSFQGWSWHLTWFFMGRWLGHWDQPWWLQSWNRRRSCVNWWSWDRRFWSWSCNCIFAWVRVFFWFCNYTCFLFFSWN